MFFPGAVRVMRENDARSFPTQVLRARIPGLSPFWDFVDTGTVEDLVQEALLLVTTCDVMGS